MAVKSFPATTGQTIKIKLSDFSTGQERVWNTTLASGAGAFENYNATNIANYGVASAETSNTPGEYQWTVPAALPANAAGYNFVAVSIPIAGASLAVSDLPNGVWRSVFGWNGSKEIGDASLRAVDVTGNVPSDLQTIKTQTVTAGSGVTFPASIGTSTLGGTAQTGDGYAILNSGSFGNASLLSAIQNIQNATFISTNIPGTLERPDSGSVTVQIVVAICDETSTPKNLDSGSPVLALVNDAGTDLSSRVGSWTNPATGKYTASYTSSASDSIEGLHWEITGTVNSKLRRYPAYMQIVDTTAVSFTSTDRTNLGLIKTAVNTGVAPGASGGILISGTNTGTTTFGALTVTGATTHTGTVTLANGMVINQATVNGHGLVVNGNGIGVGLVANGGATGAGAVFQGGSTSGSGFVAQTTSGDAVRFVSGGGNGNGLYLSAAGSGHGLFATADQTGHGIYGLGGDTSGSGFRSEAIAGNSNGCSFVGFGSGNGVGMIAGATGSGLKISTTAGDGILVTPTGGNAVTLTANGASKHGLAITGGTSGTSDAVHLTAGTGGAQFRSDIAGKVLGTGSGTIIAPGVWSLDGAGAAVATATALASLVSDLTSGSALPAIDGVPMVHVLEAMLAYLLGRSSLTDNGSNSDTLIFYKQDGTTPMFTVTFDRVTSVRPVTGSIS